MVRDEAEKELCEEYFEDEYLKCVSECNNDAFCVSKCAREYNEAILNCPCNRNCPEGCPCPNYECPSDKNLNHVLILHNVGDAMVTNILGIQRTLVWNSDPDVNQESYCSLKFQNDFYIFGQVDLTASSAMYSFNSTFRI